MAPSSIEHFHLSRIRGTDATDFLTEDTPLPPSPVDIGDIFAQPRSNEEKLLSDIHPPWRRNLFALFEQPKSSPSAFLVHGLTTFLILFSALVTVLETVPAFHIISTRTWFGVETSIVALFTVEYIARCLAWSGTWMSLLRWVSCTCPTYSISKQPLMLAVAYATSSIFRNHRPSFRRPILYRTNASPRYRTSHLYISLPTLIAP